MNPKRTNPTHSITRYWVLIDRRMWRDHDSGWTEVAHLVGIFSIGARCEPIPFAATILFRKALNASCHTGVEAGIFTAMRIWGWIITALLLSFAFEMRADGVQRPQSRPDPMPETRWTHQADHVLWNRAALSALKTHGAGLVKLVPKDVAQWCPTYPTASDADRRAFWLGFLSALAKHESTYRQTAVGGGGKWYGLLQILPGTARGYGCAARTGRALKNGAANLSCAIRIMAVTVPRDGVIYAPGGRGVAADWGPMRSRAKRADMVGYTRSLPACQMNESPRPRLRPETAPVDLASNTD